MILESIFVEGHTDSKKFSECYKIPSGRGCVFDKDHDGNWELSVFRAISVLKHFEANKNLKKMMNLKNSNDEPLFAISGYSKTRPRIIDKKVLSDDRQRRINLRFNQKEAGLRNEIYL